MVGFAPAAGAGDLRFPVCGSVVESAECFSAFGDGRPGFVGREHIKPGATVIDVGMNRLADEVTVRRLFGDDAATRLETISRRGYTLVGDVNPAEADEVAGWRTPVPGGVGLLTVAMLMRNTVKAARLRRGFE